MKDDAERIIRIRMKMTGQSYQQARAAVMSELKARKKVGKVIESKRAEARRREAKKIARWRSIYGRSVS